MKKAHFYRLALPGVLAFGLLGAMGNATAQNLFIGASAGETDLQDYGGVASSVDETDTGYNVFAGFEFSPYLGAAIEYADLGEFTGTGTGVSESIEVTGYGIVGIGTFPLTNKFDVYGKLGAFRWDQDVDVVSPGFTGSGNFTGTDATYGVGVTYNFSDNLGVQGEWRRYRDVGSDEANLGRLNDIDLLSLGIKFTF